jgi:3-hydroxybutyryl-CoA dehydrogenase
VDIKNITVIGVGLMGSGIAQTIAQTGFEVVIHSRSGKVGLNRLKQNVQKAVNRKFLTEEQATALLSRITCTSSLTEAVKTADLIVEAVIEDLEVKREVFRKVDANCLQNAIIATNTSSLSISALAEVTKRTEKVVGMHFFNPAPVMKLVEIAQAQQTSEDTVVSIIKFSEKLGKFPLVVKDSPGFVVNRILMPAINAAAFVLMEKIAPAEAIDSAMKLGANYPIGPLALADLIGVDTCLNIMRELNRKIEKSSKFDMCPLIEEMVAKGQLGRKTGIGFFRYEIKNLAP